MKSLRVIRAAKGLGLWELSSLTQITQTRLSLIERSRIEATPQERERLSAALGFPEDALFLEAADMLPALQASKAGSVA